MKHHLRLSESDRPWLVLHMLLGRNSWDPSTYPKPPTPRLRKGDGGARRPPNPSNIKKGRRGSATATDPAQYQERANIKKGRRGSATATDPVQYYV